MWWASNERRPTSSDLRATDIECLAMGSGLRATDIECLAMGSGLRATTVVAYDGPRGDGSNKPMVPTAPTSTETYSQRLRRRHIGKPLD